MEPFFLDLADDMVDRIIYLDERLDTCNAGMLGVIDWKKGVINTEPAD